MKIVRVGVKCQGEVFSNKDAIIQIHNQPNDKTVNRNDLTALWESSNLLVSLMLLLSSDKQMTCMSLKTKLSSADGQNGSYVLNEEIMMEYGIKSFTAWI